MAKRSYMNGVQHTIIGVAPEKFHGTFIGYSFNFWVPTSMQETFDNTGYKLEDRGARWIEGYAFLKPGVTRQQAQAELSAIAKRLENDYPETDRGHEVGLLPLWKTPFNAAGGISTDARHHRGRRFLCPPHRLRQREQSPPRAITLAPT